MARDGLGVAIRESTHGTSVRKINRPYHRERQVPVEDMRAARDTLARMLDGGELLPVYQGPWLQQAIIVLDESISAADRRAKRCS